MSTRNLQFALEAIDKASAKFKERDFFREAALLDETGFLQGLAKGKTQAGVEWLGLPPSEQTDFIDRD